MPEFLKSWWFSTIAGFVIAFLQIAIPMLQSGAVITPTQWYIAIGTVILGLAVPGGKKPNP